MNCVRLIADTTLLHRYIGAQRFLEKPRLEAAKRLAMGSGNAHERAGASLYSHAPSNRLGRHDMRLGSALCATGEILEHRQSGNETLKQPPACDMNTSALSDA
jgi:hypothetical protein